MTVAYQGVPGAFGHAACIAFVPDHDPVAKPDFVSVMAAVAGGQTDFGVLPVENSVAGPVHDVAALLSGCSLAMHYHDLPIRMHLLTRPGTELADVKRIVSHPIALSQCARSLRELCVELDEASNTAIAAQALASGGDAATAVLASEAAAKQYGLTILRRDMQDRADNVTRFCVFSRRA